MDMRRYKRGDRVKVWSLQSFSHGGFLNGEPGIVRQDQNDGSSVLVILTRKINGQYMLDSSYEVYDKQIELVEPSTPETLENVYWFLDLNNKIKETTPRDDKKKWDLPWQYSPECYIGEDDFIHLDKDKLKYPEKFI
jgi:hypothetical protein